MQQASEKRNVQIAPPVISVVDTSEASMKKAESEKVIRSLSTQWFATLPPEDKEHPSFGVFCNWVRANGYGDYLDFRSRMGPSNDAESWFDNELGQSWRN